MRGTPQGPKGPSAVPPAHNPRVPLPTRRIKPMAGIRNYGKEQAPAPGVAGFEPMQGPGPIQGPQ